MTRFLAVVAILCSAGSAFANPVWGTGKSAGEGCFKGDKFKSGAIHCHNCLSAGGDHVYWNITLTCDGKPTSSVARVYLDCPSGKDEGGELRALQAKVNLPKAGTACPK